MQLVVAGKVVLQIRNSNFKCRRFDLLIGDAYQVHRDDSDLSRGLVQHSLHGQLDGARSRSEALHPARRFRAARVDEVDSLGGIHV